MKAWSKHLFPDSTWEDAVSWRWDFWRVFLRALAILRGKKKKKKGRPKQFGRKKQCFSSLKRALTSLCKGLYAQRELTLIYQQSFSKDSQVHCTSSLSTWWILKTLTKIRQPGLSFLEDPPFPPSQQSPGEAGMKGCTLTELCVQEWGWVSVLHCTQRETIRAPGLQGKALTGSF